MASLALPAHLTKMYLHMPIKHHSFTYSVAAQEKSAVSRVAKRFIVQFVGIH